MLLPGFVPFPTAGPACEFNEMKRGQVKQNHTKNTQNKKINKYKTTQKQIQKRKHHYRYVWNINPSRPNRRLQTNRETNQPTDRRTSWPTDKQTNWRRVRNKKYKYGLQHPLSVHQKKKRPSEIMPCHDLDEFLHPPPPQQKTPFVISLQMKLCACPKPNGTFPEPQQNCAQTPTKLCLNLSGTVQIPTVLVVSLCIYMFSFSERNWIVLQLPPIDEIQTTPEMRPDFIKYSAYDAQVRWQYCRSAPVGLFFGSYSALTVFGP